MRTVRVQRQTGARIVTVHFLTVAEHTSVTYGETKRSVGRQQSTPREPVRLMECDNKGRVFMSRQCR